MGAIASRYRVSNSGLTSTDIQNIENANKRENPGTLDELHKKTKGEGYEGLTAKRLYTKDAKFYVKT